MIEELAFITFPKHVESLCGVAYVRIGARYVWVRINGKDVRILRSTLTDQQLSSAFELSQAASAAIAEAKGRDHA